MDIIEHSGELIVDMEAEVLSVLSTSHPMDALDVMRETEDSLKKKMISEVEKQVAERLKQPGMEGYIAVGLKSEPLDLNYDLIVEILNELITEGRARRIETTSLPQFVRIIGS